jgi:hypothetical protein
MTACHVCVPLHELAHEVAFRVDNPAPEGLDDVNVLEQQREEVDEARAD